MSVFYIGIHPHTFLYSQILEMFVNIGLEVKKSSSSKSAVAGNFTPQSNNRKLLNSMNRNPKNNVRYLQVRAGNPWSLLKTLETLECSFPSLLSFCVGSTREFWLTQSQNWRNSSSTSGHTPSSSDSWTKSFGQKIGKLVWNCLNWIWSGAAKFSFWLEHA